MVIKSFATDKAEERRLGVADNIEPSGMFKCSFRNCTRIFGNDGVGENIMRKREQFKRNKECGQIFKCELRGESANEFEGD